MSRYLILLLLNLPFIMLGLVSAITRYKMGHSSRRRATVQVALWLIVLIGLIVAQPAYEWLSARGLTQTDSLSLFDVVQITAIVIVFYIANGLRAKVEVQEKRLNDLHRELSIRLSERKD